MAPVHLRGSDRVTRTAAAPPARLGRSSWCPPLTITLPVNDAPSFTAGGDVAVVEDAGAQTAAGWATAISAGPADESGQVLTFQVSNDNNGLFSVQPAVTATGVLSFTPAADANGGAVSVVLSDDGGTANGGVVSSAPTFTITVSRRTMRRSRRTGRTDRRRMRLRWRWICGPGVRRRDGGRDLTYTVVCARGGGASLATTGTNGVFAFDPAPDFNGAASFTYR